MLTPGGGIWPRELLALVCVTAICFTACDPISVSAGGPPYHGPTETVAGELLMNVNADLIVKVKRVWTGDRANPWAEAVAARGGVIAAVGNLSDVMRFRGPSTRMIERPDAFAMPGLIDAHGHMEALGPAKKSWTCGESPRWMRSPDG